MWLSDDWGGEGDGAGDDAGEDSNSYWCYYARKLVDACLNYVGVGSWLRRQGKAEAKAGYTRE